MLPPLKNPEVFPSDRLQRTGSSIRSLFVSLPVTVERRQTDETKALFFCNCGNSLPVPDLTTARHSMEQTENYYTACSKATETVSGIRSTLNQYVTGASDEAEYFSRIQSFTDTQDALTWNAKKHTLSFSTGISDTQQLSVILEIFYPEKDTDPTLKILQWKTELTGTWKPDDHQNVFKGE